MKKTILSVAVAGSLLIGGSLVGAQSNVETGTKVYQKPYTVSFNENSNWNTYIQKLLSKYYPNFKVTTPTEKQPEQTQNTPTEEFNSQPEPQPAPVQQQPVQEPSQVETQPVAHSLSEFEQRVVTLTNNERAKYGLAPLQVDEKLSEVARTKSADMKQNGYFSHTSPTYGSPFNMMKTFGIQYRAAGENIAKGQRSPEEVVNAWMNSEGHRKNILSSSFTHIGVGHVEGNYWTQMFIGK
ncbi:CAP domain-containing protein [Fredinandcohnia humi]